MIAEEMRRTIDHEYFVEAKSTGLIMASVPGGLREIKRSIYRLQNELSSSELPTHTLFSLDSFCLIVIAGNIVSNNWFRSVGLLSTLI